MDEIMDLRGRTERLLCQELPVSPIGPWYAGYSGGLDSTVLLHVLSWICARQGIQLVALHANHQAVPQAHDWTEHCRLQCERLDVEIRIGRLCIDSSQGQGFESGARTARYQWFASQIQRGGCLFTGHHQRDQAETVLNRLFRGSGVRGLGGISPLSVRPQYHLIRPFLDLDHETISDYAKLHQLDWIEDPSNRDLSLSRNYIRAQIAPIAERHWPSAVKKIARTAVCMREAELVLEDTAKRDLESLEERFDWGDWSIDLVALTALSRPRQKNLLRHWFRVRGIKEIHFDRLEYLVRTLERGNADHHRFRWGRINMGVYRKRLYLIGDGPGVYDGAAWDLASDMNLGGGWILGSRRNLGRGLAPHLFPEGIILHRRRGGERCRLPGRLHHTRLKKYFQTLGLPPWQRERVPLLFLDRELVAIAGLTPCEPFLAENGRVGLDICVTSGSSDPPDPFSG